METIGVTLSKKRISGKSSNLGITAHEESCSLVLLAPLGEGVANG